MFSLLRFNFVLLLLPIFQDAETIRVQKFEKEISTIESRLKGKKLNPDTIFFVGSSTIRRWELNKSFPNMPIENCGFGGSQVRDSTVFAPRILLPFKPKLIVFYAGDNDINARRTPIQVANDFQAFAELILKESPKTKIIFLGIKPSPSREKQGSDQDKANALVEEYCKKNPSLHFVEIKSLFLDESGKHLIDLFVADKLHLSAKGYERLSAKIKPLLK